MSKFGRKPIKIDPVLLDTILKFGANCLECADTFNCSEDTIARYVKRKYKMTFAEYSNKRKSTVRLKLREKQIQMALNGNITMLIFLGKNMLGQSDHSTITQTSNVVQLKYNLMEKPDELRKRIKLESETKESESAVKTEGHSEP